MVTVRGKFDLNQAWASIRHSIEEEEEKAEKMKARHGEEELAIQRAFQIAAKSRQEREKWNKEMRKVKYTFMLFHGPFRFGFLVW